MVNSIVDGLNAEVDDSDEVGKWMGVGIGANGDVDKPDIVGPLDY